MPDRINEIARYIALDILAIGILLCIGNWLFWGLIEQEASIFKFWELYYVPVSLLSLEDKIHWLICISLTPLGLFAIVNIQVEGLKSSTRGEAKWMSYREAKKNNLFSKEGIILGKKWGRYIRLPGFEHVICFAPSGTGKTVSLTIPNLLTWDGSIVCTDIKLELFNKTSKFRESCGIKCYLWNPGAQDLKTHRFNPLDMAVKNKASRVDELHKIVNILIPNKDREAPIWVHGPRNLFMALALYILDDAQRPNTLGEITRVLKDEENFDAWLNELLENEDLDPLCKRNIQSYLSTPEVTRGGIKAALEASLSLFDNPIVDSATCASDFDINNLRKEKMTIYVGVTNDNLERLSPLLNLFFQQVIDAMTRKEPDINEEPNGVLFLLDEFTALRRMEILKLNIGLLRSYRVRLLMIIQDLAQLYDTYGANGAKLFLNVKAKVILTQSSLEDADYISRLLGQKSICGKSAPRENHLFSSKGSLGAGVMKPLMQAQEILKLPDSNNLIQLQGLFPIKAKKLIWYRSKYLKIRNCGPIKIES